MGNCERSLPLVWSYLDHASSCQLIGFRFHSTQLSCARIMMHKWLHKELCLGSIGFLECERSSSAYHCHPLISGIGEDVWEPKALERSLTAEKGASTIGLALMTSSGRQRGRIRFRSHLSFLEALGVWGHYSHFRRPSIPFAFVHGESEHPSHPPSTEHRAPNTKHQAPPAATLFAQIGRNDSGHP